MPPSYTITTTDVASVANTSKLVVGTVFDWGTQTILIPSTVAVVDAQWLVDAAKFAEATAIGVARQSIVSAFGKYKKGVDPETGLDILAGVEVILLDGWLVQTAKVSGSFLIKDTYKTDGSFPFVSNPNVQIRYQTALSTSLVRLPSSEGSSSLTLQQIEASAILAKEATAQAARNAAIANL